MNAFSPSMTHSPAASSWRARVRVPPASLPASGSVSPNPPSARPAQRSGSQRSCCSGVPNLWIGLAPRPTPASSVMASDWSALAISSIATHRPVRSPPPPYGSGKGIPNRPSSPIFSTVSTGNVWSRSHASACGSISAATKSRTTPRSASCSSLSSGCTSVSSRSRHAPSAAATRARRRRVEPPRAGSHRNQRSATSSPATPHAATTASLAHWNAGGSTAGLKQSWKLWANGFSGSTSPSVSSQAGALGLDGDEDVGDERHRQDDRVGHRRCRRRRRAQPGDGHPHRGEGRAHRRGT